MIKSNGKSMTLHSDESYVAMWNRSMSCMCTHPGSPHKVIAFISSSQCLRIEYKRLFSLFLLQQLPPNCICFSCSLWLHQLQLLLPNFICFSCSLDCIRFSCCSLIAFTSASSLQLCPLQLLLPDCIHFSFFSPIASTSAAAPSLQSLQLLLCDYIHFNCCSPFASACNHTHSIQSIKYEGRESLV